MSRNIVQIYRLMNKDNNLYVLNINLFYVVLSILELSKLKKTKLREFSLKIFDVLEKRVKLIIFG